MKRNIVILIFVFVLSACGRYAVRIAHIIPHQPDMQQRYEALRYVYVLVKKPDNKIPVIKKGTDENLTSPAYDAFNTRLFIHSINKRLSAIGGSVLAYCVVSKDVDDTFLSMIEPSGIVEISLNKFSVESRGQKKKKQKKDSEGNVSIETITEWMVRGNLSCYIVFSSFNNGTVFVRETVKVKKEKIYSSKPSESTYSKVRESLLYEASQRIVNRISPASVVRHRQIFREKKNKDSKKAYRLAKKGKWSEAETIWEKRFNDDTGSWRDIVNLGVSAERKRDNKKALYYYKQAEKESLGENEVKKINWNAIYGDLAVSLVQKKEPSAASVAWFGNRVAVLPFADETISIEGPQLIRTLVHRSLSEGGYNTIPLADVDEILRNHGFTQGGQLRATTPEKIAGWLKADWLLFGFIEEFNKINIGIYVKKTIKGELRLWDKKDNNNFWSSKRPVTVHSIPSKISKDGVLAHFLLNLGESWLDSMSDFPMKEETIQFTIQNIERFPLKPSQ